MILEKIYNNRNDNSEWDNNDNTNQEVGVNINNCGKMTKELRIIVFKYDDKIATKKLVRGMTIGL